MSGVIAMAYMLVDLPGWCLLHSQIGVQRIVVKDLRMSSLIALAIALPMMRLSISPNPNS